MRWHTRRNQFRLSAKRTSLFKTAGASVQSTTGSRGVRISGSNAGYSMFPGSVKGTGYPFFVSYPFTSPPVRHLVPSHFNWTLLVTWVLLKLPSDTRGTVTGFLFCSLLQKNAGMGLKLHSVARNCRLPSPRPSAIADRPQHIHF